MHYLYFVILPPWLRHTPHSKHMLIFYYHTIFSWCHTLSYNSCTDINQTTGGCRVTRVLPSFPVAAQCPVHARGSPGQHAHAAAVLRRPDEHDGHVRRLQRRPESSAAAGGGRGAATALLLHPSHVRYPAAVLPSCHHAAAAACRRPVGVAAAAQLSQSA